jgi:putative tryptophan/tyrosine transport system substrate-binding protein
MMRRREFIMGLGSAAAWPVVARAQQRTTPVVGLLNTGTAEGAARVFVPAFRQGLAETGYVEGRNLAIEYRFGTGDPDGLTELAADLVRRQVAVIASPGSTPASLAAKAATATIPIVFGIGGDPVQIGLVSNLRLPGGNVTGFSEMNNEVAPKRLALLYELVPSAARFGILVNPKNPVTESAITEARAAAAKIGREVEILTATNDLDLEAVFSDLMQKHVGALLVTPESFFYVRREKLASLAMRHSIPAIYWDRSLVEAGGLMSYGSSLAEMYRQVGIYVGRILKGEKPGDLPVMQPTKFQLVINVKTANALGLTIPETLLATADEVIQ